MRVLVFFFSLLAASVAQAEDRLTADQLVAKSPWSIASQGRNQMHRSKLFFAKEGENLTARMEWESGTKGSIHRVVFDGQDLKLYYIDKQSCGDREILYDFDLERGTLSGNLYFSGKTSGPRSRCRGGTFSEPAEMEPASPIPGS